MLVESGVVTIVVISAKTKKGIPALLDMLLLVSDVEELKADEKCSEWSYCEARMEQGRGPVAVALVESGTLKKAISWLLVQHMHDAKLGTLQVKRSPKQHHQHQW